MQYIAFNIKEEKVGKVTWSCVVDVANHSKSDVFLIREKKDGVFALRFSQEPIIERGCIKVVRAIDNRCSDKQLGVCPEITFAGNRRFLS